MKRYRPAAVTFAACAASLSLAACTVGTTTVSTTTTSPAASSRSGASASASASASLDSRAIQVGGTIGSFPVPAGAKIAENVSSTQETVIFFDMVTPAKVSSFYGQALPRAGFTVTANSVISQSGGTVAIIQFTGKGVKGNIGALSTFNDPTVSLAGLGHKNVTTVTFTPK